MSNVIISSEKFDIISNVPLNSNSIIRVYVNQLKTALKLKDAAQYP